MKEDERKEAAIASNSCLRPNFKSTAITQDQLAKFQELRRRRLQMKSQPKNKKKHKGSSDGKGKFLYEDHITKESLDENTNQRLKDPCEMNSSLKSNENNEVSSSSPQAEVHPALKKKKLHWGLDTKERWERKANM